MIPSVFQVYIAESTIEKQFEAEKFIEDLYKDSNDSMPIVTITEHTALLTVNSASIYQ